MVPNTHCSQDSRTRANIYMSANLGSASIPFADCYLLENEAVRSNFGFWKNNYPVGMGKEKAAAYLGIERNIRASNDAPEAMANTRPFFSYYPKRIAGIRPPLVCADTR
jgi:hypothetical protein